MHNYRRSREGGNPGPGGGGVAQTARYFWTVQSVKASSIEEYQGCAKAPLIERVGVRAPGCLGNESPMLASLANSPCLGYKLRRQMEEEE